MKMVMFLILTSGVLFSYSRAAWANYLVAVVCLLVILAVRRGGGRKAVAVLVLLFVTGLAVAGTLAVTGSVGFLEDRARFQSYDIERFGAQRTGIELAERYPVGIGPGQFEVVVPISTHSTYVRALAEQGVLGMIVIIALFLAHLLIRRTERRIGARLLRDRLSGAVGGVGGADDQLLRGRHAPLATPVVRGGADLGRRDAA